MRSELDMVSYALEVEPALLPFVPEVLADLGELGSDAGLIVRVLSDLQLPRSARVIDLGCGKSAVSLEIAEPFDPCAPSTTRGARTNPDPSIHVLST